MFPSRIEQLASQHTSEMRSSAVRSRRRRACRAPRRPVRHRAGWTLVEIGLRLAGTSGHA
jgi:hypothetical protein